MPNIIHKKINENPSLIYDKDGERRFTMQLDLK
ncbi:uncharacterized protein METZ01_LOCUS405786 [marine metagenome]|uniref:Uncharacterized protein n=1 Tax=marine metagenome TaxID=408172 RepID=A0A382W287_9ZZZZ